MAEIIFDHNLKTRIFSDITLRNFLSFCRILKSHMYFDLTFFRISTLLFWSHFWLLTFFLICRFSKNLRPDFFHVKSKFIPSINSWNTATFRVPDIQKDITDVSETILVFLTLTLNIFHVFLVFLLLTLNK